MRVSTADAVIDVVTKLLEVGRGAVALVFDSNGATLEGIFTERDYLRVVDVCAVGAPEQRTTANEMSTDAPTIPPPLGAMDMAPTATLVTEWMTPVDDIVMVQPDVGAEGALALMRENDIRHLVVSEDPTNKRSAEALVGVVAISQVVQLIQANQKNLVNTLSLAQVMDAEGTMRELEAQAQQLANDEAMGKGSEDIKRTFFVALSVLGTALILQRDWLHDHWQLAMWSVFALGYSGIIFEEITEFNKGAVGLLMATVLWVIYSDFNAVAAGTASPEVLTQLSEKLAEVSDICFFILAASTIVEVMDAHQGFRVITKLLDTNNKKVLFGTIAILTFFLSAVLNNLTVTIVMVSLLRKLVPDPDERKLFGGMVVVAANCGGVWTPIGDVTTTMLWINNNLSTMPTVVDLFVPSLVSLFVSTLILMTQIDSNSDGSSSPSAARQMEPLAPRGSLVFVTGVTSLLSVPVFNELTGLPPYLGMLCGLGVMWLLTDVIHADDENRSPLRVPAALAKLDTSGILFFFGVLLSVGGLESAGLLKDLAEWLSANVPSLDVIAALIGLASAVIDNVPLVAATMGMYDIAQYPTDDHLWQLIAYCAGTGGSILVIGSASGVALMGLDKVEFLWYLQNISAAALGGYLAGIATYLAGHGGLPSLLPAAMAATPPL